jgi:hypothetical protein
MGGDFLYTNAARNFKEMDKLIKYANEAAKGKIIFRYSTPAEYTAAKQATANITWPVKGGQHDDIIQDDFFPVSLVHSDNTQLDPVTSLRHAQSNSLRICRASVV